MDSGADVENEGEKFLFCKKTALDQAAIGLPTIKMDCSSKNSLKTKNVDLVFSYLPSKPNALYSVSTEKCVFPQRGELGI